MKPIVSCLAVVSVALAAHGARAWPAGPEGRLARSDALRAFEATLDGADSATEALRRWCADHAMAEPAVIRAQRVSGADKPADAEVRRRLGAGADEPIRYRRVSLTCGTHVLSQADNWYRPSLLTPEMNRRLDQTDTPFGAVVRPLGFRRQTLAVDWLFDPLTDPVPQSVLRHRAILVTSAGTPFSLVAETYTDQILAFSR